LKVRLVVKSYIILISNFSNCAGKVTLLWYYGYNLSNFTGRKNKVFFPQCCSDGNFLIVMVLGGWEQTLILLEFTARMCHTLFIDLYFVDEMCMKG